jgi:hypothetical protein
VGENEAIVHRGQEIVNDHFDPAAKLPEIEPENASVVFVSIKSLVTSVRYNLFIFYFTNIHPWSK